MTFVEPRSGSANRSHRGGCSLLRPRETRRIKRSFNDIKICMPDTVSITKRELYELKRDADARLQRGDMCGCSEAIRKAIFSEHPDHWETIYAWMVLNTGRRELTSERCDVLMLVILGHTAARKKRGLSRIYDKVISAGCASIILTN